MQGVPPSHDCGPYRHRPIDFEMIHQEFQIAREVLESINPSQGEGRANDSLFGHRPRSDEPFRTKLRFCASSAADPRKPWRKINPRDIVSASDVHVAGGATRKVVKIFNLHRMDFDMPRL